MQELTRMTLTEAAQFLRLPSAAMAAACADHRLRYVRVGRHRVVRTTPQWVREWWEGEVAQTRCR